MAKNTILMIGDGMGWEMARAAAIQKQINAGKTGDTLADFYTSGKGTGLNFQTLTGYGLATAYGTTIAGTNGVYSSSQSALVEPTLTTPTGTGSTLPGFTFNPTFNPGTTATGGGKVADGVVGNLVGYDPVQGGINPWTAGTNAEYIKYSYPDSANTATTLYTGVKSYNGAIGVDIYQQSLSGILQQAASQGKSTGLVTSVPIDHATPGAAAANVNNRNKFDVVYPALDAILQQELRIYQPEVLLGGGHPLSVPGNPLPVGVEPNTSNEFISKSTYDELRNNPNSNVYGYTFLERGKDAAIVLANTVKVLDPEQGDRLLGLYGARGQNGNLPVSSANGDYSTTGLDMFSNFSTKGLKPDTLRPLAQGETDAQFIARERNENPTLQQLTEGALQLLGKDKEGMWLMIEGGDIDWSAHDNNLDNMIGTTIDFDNAVGSVIDWISKNGGWEQNELIVTADHDHYLTLTDDFPKLLRAQGAEKLTEIDDSFASGNYWGSKPIVTNLENGTVDPESGKYGWGNHSNRPVPVYYQGPAADIKVLSDGVGKGFDSYGFAIPGVAGLIDQTTIYKSQAASVNGTNGKVNNIVTYDFKDLPVIGTTAKVNPTNPAQTVAGQDIKLGGFSGLRFEGYAANGNLKFITNTDRGPNAANADLIKTVAGDEKPFALPKFQPEIDRFELNQTTGALNITQRIGLKRPDGTPLTGLPNLQAGEQGLAYTDEVPVDLFGNRLTNDPLGGDFEGITLDKDGSFWLSDEYRPAIYHFDKDGKMLERLIPKGAPTAGGTYGTAILPEVYANRRSNRGFEGIALDGNKLYAFMQSGLDNPDTAADTTSKAASNLRILEYDTATKAVTGEYIYQLADVKLADKVGDVTAIGNGKFLVAERDSTSDSKSIKKIYQIDIRQATNINDATKITGIPAGKTIEQLTPAELTAAKIAPVTKELVADATALGYTGVEKLEGLTVINDHTLAVINDNDFGLANTTVKGDGTLSIVEAAPTKLGLISLTTGINLATPIVPTITPAIVGTELMGNLINTAPTFKGFSISPVSQSATNKITEVGYFNVDDAKGTIDGLAPSAAGYLAKAIGRSTALLATLGGNFFDKTAKREVNGSPNKTLEFFAVQDGTIAQLAQSISEGKTPTNVLFSIPNSQGTSPIKVTANSDNKGYQVAVNGTDLILNVQPLADTATKAAIPLGASYQGKLNGNVLDFRDLVGKAIKADINTTSDALYANNIGFYTVEDINGTVKLDNGTFLKPSDVGYAQAAIQNAVKNVGLQATKTDSKTNQDLMGGKLYAPVVIAQGTLSDYLAKNPTNGGGVNDIHAYFTYLGANPDKLDHFRLIGNNTFGVEDIYGGGDNDFNDVVVKMAFKTV